jgi:drug/metabolite transporter (DMT)-like permease
MTLRQIRMLLALAALWGASFLFIRVAVDDLGPVVLADGRLLLAVAGLVAILAVVRRRAAPRRVPLRRYVLLGAVNAALPFTLIAAAETRLDASLAAILNASTPLFAALVAAVVGDEAMTGRRALGLVFGVGGVGLVVGLAHVDADLAFFAAAGASLLAALCYAVGTTYAKHAMTGEAPATIAYGQLLAAGILLAPLVAVVPPHHAPTGGDLAALGALAVACTSIAYLIYFRLVAEVGPTSTLTVTYLVPVFGVLWAAIFLGERVTVGTLAGGALILASVGLVTGTSLSRRPVPAPAPAAPSPARAAERSG